MPSSSSSSTTSNAASVIIGNAAHVVSLLNVAVFALAVRYRQDLFDPLWRDAGFCVLNPDVEYWTSHDLCLYTDFFLGAVSYIVYWLLKQEKGMAPSNELVGNNIMGIFGHGIGHGAIAFGLRKAALTEDTTAEEEIPMVLWETILQTYLPLFIFWCLMLKAAMPRGSHQTIVGLSIASMAGHLGFPAQFAFTYVQSVLFAVFSWTEIMTKPVAEKGFEFALYPLLVGLPLGIVGWIESTQCSKGIVLEMGGHLIYDAYIPLSTLLFYMICWVRASILHPTTTYTGSNKTKVA